MAVPSARHLSKVRGLLLCSAAIMLGMYFLSAAYPRTMTLQPTSPVSNSTDWGGEQASVRPVDGDIERDVPSVVTFDSEAVETQSPHSVRDRGSDVGQNKTKFPSQTSTTAVANETPAVKPEAPVRVSINLVRERESGE